MCKILCQNKHCVYWEKGICSLSSVSLDTAGMCADAVNVNIKEAVMNIKKREEDEGIFKMFTD